MSGLPPGSLVYTGDREVKPSTVLLIQYGPYDYQETLLTEAITSGVKKAGGVSWIDVQALHDTSIIDRIGMVYDIHPLVLEDILDTQQRSKLEEYDNGLFFILPNLRLDSINLEFISEQISIYFGEGFVVSFQEDPDDTFAGIRKRIQEGVGRLRKKGADYLKYALIDMIVDNYYNILDDMENLIYDLEESIHKVGAAPWCKARIFELKRLNSQFRIRLLPVRDAVLRFYRVESELVDDANRLYLRDVVDHVAQIIDGIDNHRELLSNLEALYQAEAANKLNHVMRLLTVISTIFIPLSFVAGIYGMNFDNMPELHTRNGYFVVLGIMFTLMVCMLAYFKVKRWI